MQKLTAIHLFLSFVCLFVYGRTVDCSLNTGNDLLSNIIISNTQGNINHIINAPPKHSQSTTFSMSFPMPFCIFWRCLFTFTHSFRNNDPHAPYLYIQHSQCRLIVHQSTNSQICSTCMLHRRQCMQRIFKVQTCNTNESNESNDANPLQCPSAISE